jgi:hypothetical protein
VIMVHRLTGKVKNRWQPFKLWHICTVEIEIAIAIAIGVEFLVFSSISVPIPIWIPIAAVIIRIAENRRSRKKSIVLRSHIRYRSSP